MNFSIQIILFILATIPLIFVSHRSLRDPNSHGFYRFFAWETLIILFLLNVEVWFKTPFSIHQIISWVLLVISAWLAIHGFRLLKLIGQPDNQRSDEALLGLEKTSRLITRGAYRYIRHPLYASLLLLTWGIFFKQPSMPGFCLAVASSIFLTATAKIEEKENIRYFGADYLEYIRRTKMFIPYLF